MSRIIIPSRRVWTRQPQRPVEIDWKNPITKGLVSVINPAAQTPNLSVIGTVVKQVSGDKVVLACNSSGMLTQPNVSLSGGELTMFVLANMRFNNLSSVYGFGVGNGGAGNQIFLIGSAQTTSPPWAFIRTVNGGGISSVWSNLSTTGDYPAIGAWAATYGGNAASMNIYLNGVDISASRPDTAASGSVSALNNFSIGGANRGTDLLGISGTRTGFGLLFNRVLRPDEIKSLSDNPWQIFKPRTRRTIIDLGTGGGLSITATLGTADATAFVANVNLQRTISASLASAAAAGFSANIDLQRNVSATLGNAAAFGNLANVDLRRAIVASLGAAVASGYDASIELAGSLNIPASLGIASATGKQANVNLSFDLSATPGSAAAIGLSASISNEEAPFTQAQLDYLLAYMQEHLMIPTAGEIAAAVLAAMQASPPPVNVKKVNDVTITGSGVAGDSMRPA